MAHDASAAVSNIRKPRLVLVGPEERFFSIEEALQLAGMIPGARCKILPGGAHNAWMEYPDELTAELSAFFGQA
jgi:pimeloyl-ACP methyl ester carboxylesterase